MNVSRNIDLGTEVRDAHAKVVAGLERSSLFALLGECLGKLPPDLELPPVNIPVRFGGPRPVDGELPPDVVWSEMKEEFGGYCTRYAIVGTITTFEVYLQRLLLIARLGQEANQRGGSLTGETFDTIKNRCLKEVRRLSVDGLAKEAIETVGRDISAVTGLEWFRSVYGLRTCLVHRGGIVGQEDVDDKGLLTAVWRRPILSVDGEDISGLPFYVEKGGTLAIRFADEIRSWHVGERLQLIAQDCQNIGLSLAIFAGQIADGLQKGLATMLKSGADIG